MTELYSPRLSRLDPGGPDRAVIDIGSNTVRLVVYSGCARAPRAWLNEKVASRLGRDLSTTGKIPKEASDMALAAIERYANLLPDLGVQSVKVAATAATRDASNGEDFLREVRKLGFKPRQLTGEEEAHASANGVIGAFPDAHGVVADLGGGSLELISVENGESHHGESLPLGTLRLATLRPKGSASFKRAVHKAFKKAGWAAAHPGPLYMVGGTWRALATFHMRKNKHPLTDPHSLVMDVEEADRVAKKISRSEPRTLQAISGISEMRAEYLPNAAAMLRVMLKELEPSHLVFSSWGLREGLLYQRLGPAERAQDPLVAGVSEFAAPRGGSPTRAASIAAWTADIASGDIPNGERLRMAAAMLSLAALRIEPNLRIDHSQDWVLHKRWIGLDMPGRALMSAALLGACGQPGISEDHLRLADEAHLREAVAWGLAFRLCRRIGGGSRLSLMSSALKAKSKKKRLILWLDDTRKPLLSASVENDLKTLADWLGYESEVRLGGEAPAWDRADIPVF